MPLLSLGAPLGLLTFAGSVAWACVCDDPAPLDAARRAEVVFTGVAARRVALVVGAAERVEFAVETVYKGANVPSRWAVDVEATSCGYVFTDGKRYTVFARQDRTNLCMGNVEGGIDPTAYGVQPIATYRSGPLIDLDRNADQVAVAAAIAVVGLSLFIVMRRLRADLV